MGRARICPTLITASASNFLHGVKTIAEACEADPRVAACVVGIHLEGPFISEVDGYRGRPSPLGSSRPRLGPCFKSSRRPRRGGSF